MLPLSPTMSQPVTSIFDFSECLLQRNPRFSSAGDDAPTTSDRHWNKYTAKMVSTGIPVYLPVYRSSEGMRYYLPQLRGGIIDQISQLVRIPVVYRSSNIVTAAPKTYYSTAVFRYFRIPREIPRTTRRVDHVNMLNTSS